MDDCSKPAVIKERKSPTSQSSGSPDQPKRLRKSSWDNSDDDFFFAKKEDGQEKTGRIYSSGKNKNSDAEIQKLKEISLQSVDSNNEEEKNLENSADLSDRRHSPARIRRRRKSSGGSSIISDNALDDRSLQEIRQVAENVIDEKVEEVSNVGSSDSITYANATVIKTHEEDIDKRCSRTTTPKKLPPLEDPNGKGKSSANPEILHELSKNISNMFFKRSVSPNESKTRRKNSSCKKNKENMRAKSNELEIRSKILDVKHDSIRPKSEKISGSKSNIETINQEYPKPISAIVLTVKKTNSEKSGEIPIISHNTIKEVQEAKSSCEVEFETRNIRKSSGRPKSANFLIMEDLEDVNISEMCKDSGRKADRIRSADYKSDSASKSSYPSYFEVNKDSEESLGKSLSSGQSTSGSKISDIHSWSPRDVKINSKMDFDSEKWRHNFEELYRTEKSPYSERGQLTSPSDSTEKSVNSEYNAWKQAGKANQNEMEPKENNKNLYFNTSPKKSFGIGDSKEIQCWNVEKSEIKNIEEPQDHGDGNFKVKNNEENWERLMSQSNGKKKPRYNQEMKKQFWSEIQEVLDNTDKRFWLSDIEEEKQRNFSEESHSPKIAKSKWSLVNSGTEIVKPMSSNSDASTQCCIMQEKETKKPRKRKRERCQNAKNVTFKTENVVVLNSNVGIKKKETTFDYDEIKICEEEALEDPKEFLILKRSREKQTTNFKTFLAKSNSNFSAGKTSKSKSEPKNSIKSALKLWKNKNSRDLVGKLSIDKDSSDPSYEKPFHDCNCFRIFYRIFRDFFRASR